ncbi:MAG: hypothetical protein LBB81_07590 [Treponema sp.]|jgi:hypothetical protein|nr:hypothetical protein [Treponema sp.]
MPSGVPKDPKQKLIKTAGFIIHKADQHYATWKETNDKNEMAKAQNLYKQAKDKIANVKKTKC